MLFTPTTPAAAARPAAASYFGGRARPDRRSSIAQRGVVGALSLVLLAPPSPAQSPAQSPGWQWAVQTTGPGVAQVRRIVADGTGNSYVVGSFTGQVGFGRTTVTSRGGSDAFVAKLAWTGAWEWARAVGGAGADHATGVALDGAGRVFVAGSFSQHAPFGKTVLTSQGDADVFVARVSPQGEWEWAAAAGGRGPDRARALATSRAGELLVAGEFSDTARFGATALASRGGADAFVARLARTGTWQWATPAGGPDDDRAAALTTNAAGEIYVTGSFRNTAAFGDAPALWGRGLDDGYVAKLTSAGRWQWATACTSRTSAAGTALAVDPAGGVFAAGSFWGAATFGTAALQGAGDTGFVARLTDGGQWQWATALVSERLENLVGLAMDRTGTLHVAGTYRARLQAGPFGLAGRGRQDAFVGCLTRTGAWVSLTAAGAPDAPVLALGPGGEVYVGGAAGRPAQPAAARPQPPMGAASRSVVKR